MRSRTPQTPLTTLQIHWLTEQNTHLQLVAAPSAAGSIVPSAAAAPSPELEELRAHSAALDQVATGVGQGSCLFLFSAATASL